MAQALQCPTCGSTTRLEGLEPGGTLRCESCGQVMKVPPGAGRRTSRSSSSQAAPAAPPAAASVAASAIPASSIPAGSVGAATAAVVPPAPRRRSRPTMTAGGGGTAGVAGGTAVLAPGDARPIAVPETELPQPRRGRTADSAGGRETLPLWLRIGAWVVALPLGLLIVGFPARQLGYLSSQKLLDVIVKHDLSRFVPIVVVVALWALVTAVLVTVLIEGGRRWMVARRTRGSRD